jgi:hypothetical protein
MQWTKAENFNSKILPLDNKFGITTDTLSPLYRHHYTHKHSVSLERSIIYIILYKFKVIYGFLKNGL